MARVTSSKNLFWVWQWMLYAVIRSLLLASTAAVAAFCTRVCKLINNLSSCTTCDNITSGIMKLGKSINAEQLRM